MFCASRRLATAGCSSAVVRPQSDTASHAKQKHVYAAFEGPPVDIALSHVRFWSPLLFRFGFLGLGVAQELTAMLLTTEKMTMFSNATYSERDGVLSKHREHEVDLPQVSWARRLVGSACVLFWMFRG